MGVKGFIWDGFGEGGGGVFEVLEWGRGKWSSVRMRSGTLNFFTLTFYYPIS